MIGYEGEVFNSIEPFDSANSDDVIHAESQIKVIQATEENMEKNAAKFGIYLVIILTALACIFI